MKFGYGTRIVPLCLAVLAVGCGGGGSTSNPVGPTQTNQVGPVAVTFTGHPQAEVTGVSGTITAVGQAGASYSTLSMNPAHNLSSTVIAYSRTMSNGGSEIFTIPAVVSGPSTPLVHSGTAQYPAYSQSQVMTFQGNPGSGDLIETILGDGSQQKTVLPGQFIPTLSPNGATIAYVNLFGQVFTIPSGGGTSTQIGTQQPQYSPLIWSPSGTQIAFTVRVAGLDTVWTMTSTGGSPTNVTPTQFAEGNLIVNSWSPDGNSLACTYSASGSSISSVVVMSPTGNLSSILSPLSYNDAYPSFSPDSSRIAFYRSNANGATPGIYTEDVFGDTPQLLCPDPPGSGATGPVTGLVWSPFQESKNFVGAGGTITGSPVAGFLVAQNGSQFGSLLAFTATTPSTATVTQSASNASGAPIVFTLGADSITNISYANVYNGAHSSIPLTGTTSTVVSVDGVTGLIDFVAPAVAGKARPAVVRSSGTALTYTGDFSGIFDSTGKNLAPGGASSFQFDRVTGKLVSFR